MTGVELIQGLISITSENKSFVEKKMKHFSEEQLNWRPQATVWSLNEILAHLNVYAAFYHDHFDRLITKTNYREPTQNFVSSPLGKAAWASMKLGKANNLKRKFKAISRFNPSNTPSLVSGQDGEQFIRFSDELLNLLERAKEVNIRKVKSPLSISKIIKFRLGDALNFVVYHNERHIQQAKNLMDHPQFPKKR